MIMMLGVQKLSIWILGLSTRYRLGQLGGCDNYSLRCDTIDARVLADDRQNDGRRGHPHAGSS